MARLNNNFTAVLLVTLMVLSLMAANAVAQPTPTPTQNPPTASTSPNQPTPTPTSAPSGTPPPSPNIDAIHQPSTPEFTVKLVEGPHDVPSTYWISAFTGKNLTFEGTHIDSGKKAIILEVKNQPFTSYYDPNSGWNITIYYSVRSKLHTQENWTGGPVEDLPVRTDSEYTFLVYQNLDYYPAGVQVDFQVQAMEGYVHRVWDQEAAERGILYPYRFTGKTSGWSNTQTIRITAKGSFVWIVSPENTSYVAVYDPIAAIPLIYETGKPLSWVGYSLDGGSNVTVPANGTLLKIPAQSRSLTLYANDTDGNWAVPQTVYYSIAFNLGVAPILPPIVPIAVVSGITAIIAIGLLVHFKKQKMVRKKN